MWLEHCTYGCNSISRTYICHFIIYSLEWLTIEILYCRSNLFWQFTASTTVFVYDCHYSINSAQCITFDFYGHTSRFEANQLTQYQYTQLSLEIFIRRHHPTTQLDLDIALLIPSELNAQREFLKLFLPQSRYQIYVGKENKSTVEYLRTAVFK